MLSLVLLFAFLILSAQRFGTRIDLPTKVLRWTAGFTFACAQLVSTVQLLSLFKHLTPGALLMLNAIVTLGVWCVPRRGGSKGEDPGTSRLELWKWYRAQSRFHQGLLIIALSAWAVATLVSPWAFVATDAYHVTMCLAWAQHGTVQAFPVHDPRVVGVVFASEALAFPGFLYAKSPLLFFVFASAAALGCAVLIFELTRNLGVDRQHGITASLLFLASAPLLGSVWTAKSDFLLSSLWLLASLLCLFETRNHPHVMGKLLACSAFTFAMACGSKNTITLHAPAYLLAIGILLRKELFRVRVLGTLLAFGILGALASGVIWSYAQNHFWFGDWRGSSFLQSTLSKSYDFPSVWTRLCRSVVIIGYDCGWLPNAWQPEFAKLTDMSIRMLGGRQTLPEDSEFYTLDLATFRAGAGMGFIGPAVLLPTLVVGLVTSLWAHRVAPQADSRDQRRALGAFVVVSFVLFSIALRTQNIGISRLMLSWVATAMPLSALLFSSRAIRWMGACAGFGSLALTMVHCVTFAAQRNQIALPGVLGALKRTPPATIQVRWGDASEVPHVIREPYTSRELYTLVAERIPRGAVVGYIAGHNGEAYPAFGPDYSNRVLFLKDYYAPRISRPPSEIQFVIVEDFDPERVPTEILTGFRPILRARANGVGIFGVFERGG